MSTPTQHALIVAAIASTDRLASTHSQRCPIWTRRTHNPPITDCDCWRLTQIEDIAAVVCARLNAAASKAAKQEATR